MGPGSRLFPGRRDWHADQTSGDLRGFPIVGTKEQIVETMAQLSDCGIDGILLTFPQYNAGMARFMEEVYPLVVQAGFR